MQKKEVFINIYERITGWRFLLIVLLFIFGGFFIYYSDVIVTQLEEREQTYVKLYVRSLESLISNQTDGNTDISFLVEVLEANKTIPLIYVDPTNEIAFQKNVLPDSLESQPTKKKALLQKELEEMRLENKAIPVLVAKYKTGYVYYRNSFLIKQLRYFPIVQIIAFLILGALAYLAISASRTAEQNRVWVGLAKETAHQLGTPISALMGWIELLRADPNFDASIANELEKDVERLDTVTKRFSSIGSVPQMNSEAIVPLITNALSYLKKRISTKVKLEIINEIPETQQVILNKNLLEWVVENLCKNAVDAMGGIGALTVTLSALPKNNIAIDISDTGKGISNNNLGKVFNAGFSTKKRGWGLGLTLAKRIIENYHKGRLFVKDTQLGKGTTFRIILKGSEQV